MDGGIHGVIGCVWLLVLDGGGWCGTKLPD